MMLHIFRIDDTLVISPVIRDDGGLLGDQTIFLERGEEYFGLSYQTLAMLGNGEHRIELP